MKKTKSVPDYTPHNWNRIAILGKELGWPEKIYYDDLREFGIKFLGGANALMFIRKTNELKLGNNWFRVPRTDECPSDAIAEATKGNDYLYASIRNLRIPAQNSLKSRELFERIEQSASEGPFIFYVFQGVAPEKNLGYVKIGYARTLQHVRNRRQFRIKRDGKEDISVHWLCAVPLSTEKDARWLERSFEDTFGSMCLRRHGDQNRRSEKEFYQPTSEILEVIRKIAEKYPAPETR
jgi:hypothetical protein